MSNRYKQWVEFLEETIAPTEDAFFAFVDNPNSAESTVRKVRFQRMSRVVTGGKTLPILSSLPPFSGRNAAALQVIESSGAGTGKPLMAELLFDAATIEARQWCFEATSAVVTPVLRIGFRMASANVSKNVVLAASLAAVSAGDASVSAKVFGTVNSVTIAVPDAANTQAVATITLTNADSLAQNDLVTLELYRDATNAADDASGDLIINYVRFEWSS